MSIKQALFYSILFLCTLACKEKRYLNQAQDENIKISLQRFDTDFNLLKVDDNISELREQYGELYKIYNQGILRIAPSTSPYYIEQARNFLNDSIYQMVYDTVQIHYDNTAIENEKLTEAFQNYHILFPKRIIPRCYTHISGFNEAIVVSDSILSISLENYLGKDHIFYKNLGVYSYQLNHKKRELIAIDAMRGWLESDFPKRNASANLLSNIIYEGKILFILETIMPRESKDKIIGVTKEQLTWLNNNENRLWSFMIEEKHLFSTRQSTIAKYINDGPFFNFLGTGSSPLVGKYIGLHIVRNYMLNNEISTIKDLIKNNNHQEILQKSKYKPK